MLPVLRKLIKPLKRARYDSGATKEEEPYI